MHRKLWFYSHRSRIRYRRLLESVYVYAPVQGKGFNRMYDMTLLFLRGCSNELTEFTLRRLEKTVLLGFETKLEFITTLILGRLINPSLRNEIRCLGRRTRFCDVRSIKIGDVALVETISIF